jgi:hypothetical protein
MRDLSHLPHKIATRIFFIDQTIFKTGLLTKLHKNSAVNLLGGHNIESKGRFYCPKFNCFKFKFKSKLVRLTKKIKCPNSN